MPRYALLTYEKAGSQWARDVVFGDETLAAVPGAVLSGPNDFSHRLGPWAASPELTCSGPFYNMGYEEWAAWSRPEDRALHVYRDPRDRLISWVFSMSFSHRSYPVVEALRGPLCTLDLRDRISLGIVITGQAGMWMARSWLYPKEPRNFYSVAFERLIDHPAQEYAEIFKMFEWDISPERLDSILRHQAFEVRSGGRARGETNELSHYRRGVAGDWKNYFDRGLGKLFEENYPQALIDLGYEERVDWYEALPETNETLMKDATPIAARNGYLLAEVERLRHQVETLEASYAGQSRLLAEYQNIAARMTGEN